MLDRKEFSRTCAALKIHPEIFRSVRPKGLLILLFLSGVAYYFYGSGILTTGPASIHYIRQTDSLAFISHFRHYTMDLFRPGILDLRNAPQNGMCAGEFPIVYWLIAGIEQVVGDMPYLLKWVNLVLVLVGYWFLIRAVSQITKSFSTALGVGLLLFNSSVLVYYACNFLPDVAAYGLVLVGWSYAMPTLFNGGVQRNSITLIAFILAGMLKAPMAMHLLVWVILLMLNGSMEFRSVKGRFLGLGREWVGLLLVACWHFYVIWYNAEHGSRYFLTWIEPIWEMSADERVFVADLAWNYWWTKYLHPTTWHFVAVTLVLLVVMYKRSSISVNRTIALLALFSLGFILCFFRKFADHDYYFITLMPLVVWLIITAVLTLRKMVPKRLFNILFIPGIWLLALASGSLAKLELERRYARTPDRYARTENLVNGLRDHMKSVKLPRTARVVVVGDSTSNGALLELGRQGWTYPGFPFPEEPIIEELVDQGATHILYLGSVEPDLITAELLDEDDGWSLWQITQ